MKATDVLNTRLPCIDPTCVHLERSVSRSFFWLLHLDSCASHPFLIPIICAYMKATDVLNTRLSRIDLPACTQSDPRRAPFSGWFTLTAVHPTLSSSLLFVHV